MKFGNLSIYVALISIIYSSWFYYQAHKTDRNHKSNKQKDNNFNHNIKHARFGFYAMTAWISVASFYLWYLIFTHQFQVDYIYRYTSSDLGTGYLFSAFWAGQEGSFLFWALMIALMGVIFVRYAEKLESISMLTVNIVQGAFLLLLIKANPFALSGSIPPEGAGLNPLLQNPWMVIHPPILFLGYAATTVPFAIAIAALLNRDFKEWIKIAFPWTLFASITMGAGIIIGGYWAYKVLGWGGYWGWDPVENSSLIAWLVVLALFHGLLVSRFREGFQKTNFALAILSFALVLYATFLTRSGVLADFSVHSFQDLGINGILTLYILASLLVGFALLYQRKNEIPFVGISFDSLTKENILVIAVLIIVTSAFFILLGTSSPLITELLGKPAQVNISFYNRINLPIGILMSLSLGIAPVLLWKTEELKTVISKLSVSVIIAGLSAVVAISFGMVSILNTIFLISAVFAFSSNMMVLIQNIKYGWKLIVAPLAHVGVALMLVGIIISGVFDKSERVVLTENTANNVLGYDLLYKGKYNGPDGKNGVLIEVKNGNSKFTANPRLYQNSYTKSEMREPHVEENFLSDLYIAPLQVMDKTEAGKENTLTMKKGEKKQFAGYDVQFSSFDMDNHEQIEGDFKVAAVLQFSKDNETFEVKPAIVLKGQEKINEPAHLPFIKNQNSKAQISLSGMNPDTKNIQLSFEGLNEEKPVKEKSSQIVVEVSNKPFMSMLWIGTILLTLGTILAMKRRTLDLKTTIPSGGQ
ncbi:MAG: heme lyase CcmF/NrfE family subunit [Calditrichaeota bacterium]|nr:MAG: heme lyase CcmF/NrfE family subunit [Calditrichota bacterium]MBL1207197.1 heme lyase CcmF/NrfE family subunit [Calditrichota bacterium]NOG47030.1 heme lyase CcmF/NrfE family subunit [Calditrichota bacterium]